jgi:aminopeptidase N
VTYAAGPARDFFLAASERFTVQSQAADDVMIRSYTLPEFEEASPTALAHAANALAIFEKMLGEFPYTELDIVSTGLQALGMEYPGAFALALSLYDPQNTRYGPVVLEATIVHELAHQWFFNLVGNDTLREPWLDEALAQFATLAYFEEAYGPSGAEGFREALQERWQRVGEAEIPIGMPVGSYTPQEYGAIVYGRGPLFLEELREEMGRATFGEFLRDYVQSNRWQIVTTAGFRSLAEDHCRCDLGLLFAGWIYPP